MTEIYNTIDQILAKINIEMEHAKHYFQDSAGNDDFLFWEGAWKTYVQCYIIVVEVLSELKKKEEE